MAERRGLLRSLAAAAALGLLLGGCAYIPRLPPVSSLFERSRPRRGVYHTVLAGQTLWRISRYYKVDVEEIAVLNGISNPDRLRAGQRLFIPGATRRIAVPVTAGGDPPPPKHRPSWAEPLHEKAPPVLRAPRRDGGPVQFAWPVKGKVIERYGKAGGVKHDGLAIAAPEETPVRAAAPGRVIFSDWGPGGYGRTIIIRHGGGEYHSVYAHNAENLVRKGDFVRQGTLIARVGKTGNVEQAQLHFEIRHRTIPRNPLSYLR